MNIVEDEFSVFDIGVDVGWESFSLCEKRVPEVRAQDVDKNAERDDGEDTEGCEYGHGRVRLIFNPTLIHYPDANTM